MASREIALHYQPCIIKIPVQTHKEENIRVVVQDAYKKNTVYTDRWTIVNGKYDFYVRIPICGSKAIISVFNTKIGNVTDAEDTSFTILNTGNNKIEKLPLQENYEKINPFAGLMEFIDFSKKFCFNAGDAPLGTYVSPSGKFVINYVKECLNYQEDGTVNGVVNTPFRISTDDDKLIEANQKIIKSLSVPIRECLICHEAGHGWMNTYLKKNPQIVDEEKASLADELEADINGLKLYLAMGFPRIEAHYAWNECFQLNPTEENRIRTDAIVEFIKTFDKSPVYEQ